MLRLARCWLALGWAFAAIVGVGGCVLGQHAVVGSSCVGGRPPLGQERVIAARQLRLSNYLD